MSAQRRPSHLQLEPRSLKIVVMGEAKVGKSMIVSQWRDRGFLPAYIPTAGQQRYTLNNWHVGEEPLEVRLEIYDTAGDASLKHPSEELLKEVHCLLLVFALDSHASFDQLSYLYDSVVNRSIYNTDYPIILVGNKKDLDAQREVLAATMETWQVSHPHVVAVVETSAKTGDGCKDLLFLAAEHANRYELNRSEMLAREALQDLILSPRSVQRRMSQALGTDSNDASSAEHSEAEDGEEMADHEYRATVMEVTGRMRDAADLIQRGRLDEMVKSFILPQEVSHLPQNYTDNINEERARELRALLDACQLERPEVRDHGETVHYSTGDLEWRKQGGTWYLTHV